MHNIPAEFGFLAGIIKYPNKYFDFAQYLSIDDFYSKEHQTLFVVLQRILLNASGDVKITKPMLLAEAATMGIQDFYKQCRDGELIEAVLSFTCAESDVSKSFSLVKKERIKREYDLFLREQTRYVNGTSDTVKQIINNIDSKLISLSSKLDSNQEKDIIHLPNEAEKIINDLADKPGELGLNIGFPIWQRAIGGLRNGSVTFVAATAKCGKSMLGARAAVEAARFIPVLYCDSELNETIQSVRTFGMFTEIPYDIIETGYWKQEPGKILEAGYDKTFATQCQLARNTLSNKEVWGSFRSLKLSYKKMTGMMAREMIPYMRRWILQNVGIDNNTRVPRALIVFDYIKLARVDEVARLGVGAHDVIGDSCMALHDFCEEFNIPMLAFGQTNRLTEPDLNAIAGAKKITELTSSISIMYKKDQEDLVADPIGSHKFHVIASRYGRGVEPYINFNADLSIGKFTELGIGNPKYIQPNTSKNESNKIKD